MAEAMSRRGNAEPGRKTRSEHGHDFVAEEHLRPRRLGSPTLELDGNGNTLRSARHRFRTELHAVVGADVKNTGTHRSILRQKPELVGLPARTGVETMDRQVPVLMIGVDVENRPA